jgi:hypothetical protein
MSLKEIYKKINTISPKVELAQVEIELSIIDDFQKERGDLIAKNNITNEIAKLIAISDYNRASFNRLLDKQKIALKQLTDLGLTEVANELKRYMALNSESIKNSERVISILQSIKK